MDLLIEILEKFNLSFDTNLAQRVISEYGKSDGLIILMTPIAESLLPIGLCFLALHWAADLFGRTLKKEFNLEDIVRCFLKLIVGAMILNNCIPLLTGIETFVEALLTDIQNKFGTTSASLDFIKTFADEIANAAKTNAGITGSQSTEPALLEYKIYALFAILIQMLLPGVLSFVISMVAYGRALRLCSQFIFAPIGLSDIYQGGTKSGGVMYFKNLLAIYCEPIITYLSVSMGLVLMNLPASAFVNSSISKLWPWIVVIGMISMIFKSKNISKSIFM